MTKNNAKWNWGDLKLEFFLSDEQNVKAFFEHKYSIYNRYIASKTKGWAATKKERARRIRERVLAEQEENEVQMRKAMLTEVRKLAYNSIENGLKTKKMSPQDIYRLWKIARTENDLPTIASRVITEEKEPTNLGKEARKRLQKYL